VTSASATIAVPSPSMLLPMGILAVAARRRARWTSCPTHGLPGRGALVVLVRV
jgi:hypothetical protein